MCYSVFGCIKNNFYSYLTAQVGLILVALRAGIKTGNRSYDYIATFVAILNIGSKNVYILWVTYYIILPK